MAKWEGLNSEKNTLNGMIDDGNGMQVYWESPQQDIALLRCIWES